MKGPGVVMMHVLARVKTMAGAWFSAINQCVVRWTALSPGALAAGSVADLTRSKTAVMAENALLRQQLIVLKRQIARPRPTALDRFLLVLRASTACSWRSALHIVQPDTLLRWHRLGFRLFWRARSRPAAPASRVAPATVALVVEMARDNRLWGAERIRGEILKLGITLSKRTIQKYMRWARPPRRSGQTWATFLRNPAADVWACDFVQVTDLCVHSPFAFFIVEHASRRVIHVGVTRHPTDAWVAQQRREATPFGTALRFPIHDNDHMFGPEFTRVATTSRIDVLRIPYRVPRDNALGERFLGSVRRACIGPPAHPARAPPVARPPGVRRLL